jgi:hypothetical protein
MKNFTFELPKAEHMYPSLSSLKTAGICKNKGKIYNEILY